MSYSINEVAKMMGVNASAIRYYDEVGILPNIKRVNGMRVFEDEDFKWLRVLNCMKKINMPISKIKEYVDLAMKGDDTLEERYELIKEQKKNVLNEIEALKNSLKEFEFKEWYYETAIELGSEDKIKDVVSSTASLDIDIIPSDFMKERDNNE